MQSIPPSLEISSVDDKFVPMVGIAMLWLHQESFMSIVDGKLVPILVIAMVGLLIRLPIFVQVVLHLAFMYYRYRATDTLDQNK